MRSRLISSILVSASMMSAVPAMAATSASSLSVAAARSGAPASGDSNLAGGGAIGLAIAAGVVAILVVGLVIANDDNDEKPASA